MSNLVHVGDFCPNAKCTDYRKLQTDHQRNIIKFGHTQAGRQRYRCQTCKQTFTETKGTLFTRGQLDGLWAYVGNKGEKKAMPKPKRLASSGARPCRMAGVELITS